MDKVFGVFDKEYDSNDMYQQIVRSIGTNDGILKKIYNNDKAAFDRNLINKLILICQKKEYGINDLLELEDIVKLSIFSEYIEEKNIERLSILEKYLDAYLSAICKSKNLNFFMMRNKLLPLLRVKTKPPVGELDILSKGKVIMKYPELVNNRKINNNVDIAHMIRAQQLHVRNSPGEEVTYVDSNNSFGDKQIVLTGPIFTTVATGMINLQNIMLRNDNDMGITVKPFLEVNTVNWDV